MTRGISLEIPITIRTGSPLDAAEINALFISRKYDAEPGYPDYTDERIAWFIEYGEDYFRRMSETALQSPDQAIMSVALYEERIIGYTHAEMKPDDSHCMWHGLTVARQFEGQGAGSLLEATRQRWAFGHQKAARCLVVAGNDRSMRFFKQQGFTETGIIEPTLQKPMRFSVMELGWTALERNCTLMQAQAGS